MHAPLELADISADVLARIKSRAPRVHCITNSVAQAYTANMLLAAGAVPSMTILPEEIAAFEASTFDLKDRLHTFVKLSRGEKVPLVELSIADDFARCDVRLRRRSGHR